MVKTTLFILALGVMESAQALWSPEPVDLDSLRPMPVAGPSSLPAENREALGYTPPLDLQKIKSGDGGQEDDPLTRRLAAGQALEAIEIPFVTAKEAASMGTFTRVNSAAAGQERGTGVAGHTADVPIPGPAGYWLILGALPALLLVRRRHQRQSG